MYVLATITDIAKDLHSRLNGSELLLHSSTGRPIRGPEDELGAQDPVGG